ncbi:hypothetical protein [Candidatus Cryosericum septentrionale]|nr:hypothetical protein [Candidatus Cryosericum septentrionale]
MGKLRQALEKRTVPPTTVGELATYLNVQYKTAWGWIAGRNLPKDTRTRQVLFSVLGLDEATVEAGTKRHDATRAAHTEVAVTATPDRERLISLSDEIRSLSEDLSAKLAQFSNSSGVGPDESDQFVKKFRRQLKSLSATLALALSDSKVLQELRSRVNVYELAYVTTLLGAVLDNQKLELWKAFRDLPGKGGKGT